MQNFMAASDFTNHCFNPHGLKPYRAVFECRKHELGFASYDLTILDFGDHYRAAHGSVINSTKFTDVKNAAKWLLNWYETNKQRAAKQEVTA